MPATLNPAGVKPPVHEQISELQNKIQLLEGDRKAFYESSQWTIKKNRESIAWLRQENKKLHKKLAAILAGEEQIIKEVFRDRAAEKASLKNKSGEGAIEFINHRLCEKINRLNDLKHQVEVRKRRLEELQLQYDSKVREARGFQEVEEGNVEAGKTLRRLENQLEKARLKVEEAEHVTGLYRQLKAHMQEQSLTAQTQLDVLEAEILRLHQELHGLQAMNTDAQATRDTTREQLQLQEDSVYRERYTRELKLSELKKQADERRAQNERAERRALRERLPLQTEELLSNAQRNKGTILRARQLLGTVAMEETFEKIKMATGVTNSREVVRRFLAQGETFQQLEQLMTQNEEALVQLREEKEALEAELQALTYSGEARVTGAQRLLEELRTHLRQETTQRDVAKGQLDKEPLQQWGEEVEDGAIYSVTLQRVRADPVANGGPCPLVSPGGALGSPHPHRAVLQVLELWLRDHPEDFREPPQHPSLRQLHGYLRQAAPGSEGCARAKGLLQGFQEEPGDEQVEPEGCDSPGAGPLALGGKGGPEGCGEPPDLLSFSVEEVAEQITLMDIELFMQVRPFHCLGCVWSQRDRKAGEGAAPSVRATVAQFNAVTGCVVASVLGDVQLRAPQRARLLEKWVAIAQHCYFLRNFSSLRAVISALQPSPGRRLKRPWAAVSRPPPLKCRRGPGATEGPCRAGPREDPRHRKPWATEGPHRARPREDPPPPKTWSVAGLPAPPSPATTCSQGPGSPARPDGSALRTMEPRWSHIAALCTLLAWATCTTQEGAGPDNGFNIQAALLLGEEPLDPKCFTRCLEDLTCFWESSSPPSATEYGFFYVVEGDAPQRCNLSVARTPWNSTRFTCIFPPQDTPSFTPLHVGAYTGNSSNIVHARTIMVNQLWLGQRNACLWWSGNPGYLEEPPSLLEVLSEGRESKAEGPVPPLPPKAQGSALPSRPQLPAEPQGDYLVLDEQLMPCSLGEDSLLLLDAWSSAGVEAPPAVGQELGPPGATPEPVPGERVSSSSSFEYTVFDPSSELLAPCGHQRPLKYSYLLVSDSGISADYGPLGTSTNRPNLYTNLCQDGGQAQPFPASYVACS
ncbi:hypothetical protein UY3_05571 [Chelonia mydas]|uniref:Ras-GEF domain-containing protein n=1 Tax=Chelonia mydas TaxID=8469 RepID=M7C9G3_CHEMY|nr:hypothetical protein UY3_05571 [Chelonia mydas]